MSALVCSFIRMEIGGSSMKCKVGGRLEFVVYLSVSVCLYLFVSLFLSLMARLTRML